ncbi:MAG: iron ABC transporter permease [Deltaproteobacteria bacterium]|nr:iron ABC transporter permease [Deltaproteobacteria bacterium]MBW2068462.1 iron ABC transporter permease [Deltaproteobacteria bacterium]
MRQIRLNRFSNRDLAIGVALTLLLLVTAVFSLTVGAVSIPLSTIVKIVLPHHRGDVKVDEGLYYIVVNLRLARIVLAMVVGASLALAGVVYQGILLNPLADPYTLGVSTGAAFGASLAILFGSGNWTFLGFGILPLAAFVGALFALIVVYGLGHIDGRLHPTTLILAGIIVSTFLSAGISLLKSLHEESVSAIVFWIMGSLSGKGWNHCLVMLPYFVVCSIIVFFYSRELDLLALGDVHAHHLGVSVGRVRIILLSTASLITAAAVSLTGIIGFVGLVVPHIVRFMVGPRHHKLLFYSFFAGAVLLVGADTVARTILGQGQELPVGVVTALIGGPFFCVILFTRKKQMGISS